YMDEAERCTTVSYIYNSRLLVVGDSEDLKKRPEVTPPGTQRFAIDADHPTPALAALREAGEKAGILDATLFGQAIHVLVRDAVTPARLAGLAQSTPDRIRPITPTLEDVFVTLTAHAGQNASRAAPPAERARET